MTEEKQPILLRLGRGYNGFYCPKTRFHLVGKIKPQGFWPADQPLTTDIKRALRGGTLIDVNNVLDAKTLEFVVADIPMSSADRKKEQLVALEEAQKLAQEQQKELVSEQGEILSESDIDTCSKRDLAAFIKKNELELEGLNSSSTADDLKKALKLHFGYIAA